jgi:hypothetical protein
VWEELAPTIEEQDHCMHEHLLCVQEVKLLCLCYYDLRVEEVKLQCLRDHNKLLLVFGENFGLNETFVPYKTFGLHETLDLINF